VRNWREPRFDVEISRAIDAPRRRIWILDRHHTDMRRCR
jgi:hypothetical protein